MQTVLQFRILNVSCVQLGQWCILALLCWCWWCLQWSFTLHCLTAAGVNQHGVHKCWDHSNLRVEAFRFVTLFFFIVFSFVSCLPSFLSFHLFSFFAICSYNSRFANEE